MRILQDDLNTCKGPRLIAQLLVLCLPGVGVDWDISSPFTKTENIAMKDVMLYQMTH